MYMTIEYHIVYRQNHLQLAILNSDATFLKRSKWFFHFTRDGDDEMPAAEKPADVEEDMVVLGLMDHVSHAATPVGGVYEWLEWTIHWTTDDLGVPDF